MRSFYRRRSSKAFFFIPVLTVAVAGGCTYFGPGIYHRVSEGETLWSISRAYKINPDELRKANRKHLDNPDRIKAGQKVYVPGARRPRPAGSEKVEGLDFDWPVRGEIVHEYGRDGTRRYLGVGIGSPEGTPVLAAERGRVIFASENFRSYGNTIIIEHDRNYATVYAHNGIIKVEEGQVVEKGEKIAEVGQSGHVDSPRLYFEIRHEEEAENPLHMLPR